MNFNHIAKTFNIIAKNLYDNSLYNNIQFHSLILHQKIMEVHFLRRAQDTQDPSPLKALATKILEKLIRKFKQIKEKHIEINEFLASKFPDHDTVEKNPILLSNLPTKKEGFLTEDESEWSKKKLEFIEEYESNVDNYLFSQTWVSYKTLNIYEDEDELIVNCWTINPTTVNEYLKEIKDKIMPALFDSIRLVIDYISSPLMFQAPGGTTTR